MPFWTSSACRGPTASTWAAGCSPSRAIGFVLTAAPDRAGRVRALFRERGIACERVGTIDRSLELRLVAGGRDAILWDLARQPFTGFGSRRAA